MSAPDAPNVQAAFEAAVQLHQRGDFQGAEQAYQNLLKILPNYAPALCNLAVLHAKNQQFDQAEKLYQLALASNPNFADASYNLGNLYRRLEQFSKAQEQFRSCLQNQPNHVNAAFNLGVVSVSLGDLQTASEAFQLVIQLEPNTPETYLRLGDVLLRLGQATEGAKNFQRYAELMPNDPRGLYNLGLALANQGKPGEAQELLQNALKIKPDYAEAHNALGLALELLGRKDDALFHYERAVQIKPDLADARNNLGTNLLEQGRCDEAIVQFRESLRIRPNAPAIHSNLLLNYNYTSNFTPDQVLQEHLTWGQLFATPVQPAPDVWPPQLPNRRLKIGYISSDFRQHTVAGLLRILLKYHQREHFEVFAFPSVLRPDSVTEELRSLADHWHPIIGITDAQVAETIHQLQIDILIDLGGHTAGNRLITLAYRPAAIQATMFGYPNTTGMGAVDYRITDVLSDPVGQTEAYSSESLLRLPGPCWVYHEPHDTPDVELLPALQKKTFTFGCLNNSAKISDATVAMWTKLIQSTPGSRLILLAGHSQVAMKRLTDRFVRAGILRERLQLLTRLPRQQYFEMYNQIDLALDPFPYNGGVTTCDALWMGVPVLTLAGKTYVSRQGLMQMHHVGYPEFVFDTEEQFLATAKQWLKQRDQLSEIRQGLRARLQASPLMNAPLYVQELESALRQAWQERLAPASSAE